MQKCTSFLLFFLWSLISFGQKIEKESRIASEKVPKTALEFVFNVTESHKVKWYFEENEKGNSYEAKFYLDRKKLSVEFDLEGNLQDVEIEISKSNISTTVKKSIRKYFKVYFKKYRILKVQKQYRGDASLLRKQIKDASILKSSPIFYEIVVIGKKTKNVNSIEFLFDTEGNLISSKTIQQNNSDHLDY